MDAQIIGQNLPQNGLSLSFQGWRVVATVLTCSLLTEVGCDTRSGLNVGNGDVQATGQNLPRHHTNGVRPKTGLNDQLRGGGVQKLPPSFQVQFSMLVLWHKGVTTFQF